jgi:chemotaxis signal transduction protein
MSSQKLPSNLVLARVGPFTIALPFSQVEGIGSTDAEARLCRFKGQYLPLVPLAKVLGDDDSEGGGREALVVEVLGVQLGLHVDEVLRTVRTEGLLLHPLPAGGSTLPEGAVAGIVLLDHQGAFLLTPELLITEQILTEMADLL